MPPELNPGEEQTLQQIVDAALEQSREEGDDIRDGMEGL